MPAVGMPAGRRHAPALACDSTWSALLSRDGARCGPGCRGPMHGTTRSERPPAARRGIGAQGGRGRTAAARLHYIMPAYASRRMRTALSARPRRLGPARAPPADAAPASRGAAARIAGGERPR